MIFPSPPPGWTSLSTLKNFLNSSKRELRSEPNEAPNRAIDATDFAGQSVCIFDDSLSHRAYRDGLAVRLLPVQYPLSQGQPVHAGEPVAAAGLAVPAESFGGGADATAVRAGVEARGILG